MSENFENLNNSKNPDEETPVPLGQMDFRMKQEGGMPQWTFNNEPLSPEVFEFSTEGAEVLDPAMIEADGEQETVSPMEAREIFETGEQNMAIDILSIKAGKDKEDILNDQETASWISDFIESHPLFRTGLKVAMLSTALAGAAAPQEAKADMFGDIVNTVAQGVLQQGRVASQQQIYQEQAADRQALQKQQTRTYAQLSQRDLLNRQQIEREDLAHRRAMEDIKDRYAREDAELSYRQQRELKMAAYNQMRQEEAQNTQAQIQEAQMKQQQKYQQQQIGVNTQNQVIQRGVNEAVRTGDFNFLQNILMPKR